ncbi:MAG: 1,4-alpha-glucan branching protein GlgB [Clostridiales bacterium]|nr:1,4-alpha-glucan branching protein GlgB [Clostridiales bacterium]
MNINNIDDEAIRIIESRHHSPHNFLGMHEINLKNKKKITIRAFFPDAKNLYVIKLNNSNQINKINKNIKKSNKNKFLMKKIHSDGLFILNINSKKINYYYELEDFNKNIKKIYDSYNFEPIITDFDLHLFSQGTHYEIYNKLGAHKITLNKISGVYFAVWSPNAVRVSVIGNFNNWDGRVNQMRALKNSGIWEIFIPDLKNFELYKFEIKTKDNYIIKKADPYANYCELNSKTASSVFDINNFKWSDNDWIKSRDFLNKAINIYEAHIGSWKRICDKNNNRIMNYREFADEIIIYLKDMNYNFLELMPNQEYPYDKSWGYQITGYYSPTNRYGNPEDFAYLINKCHENNIGVILDWVPAHFPKDEHGLIKFDGTCLYEHEDKKQSEHPDWGTLIFNYSRNEVKNFLIANALFWIEKYHIDGLRVDAVSSMLYLNYSKRDNEWITNKFGGHENLEAIEFIKHLNSIIHKRNKNVLMIAEESTAWPNITSDLSNDGLGFDLKWNMGWMNDFLKYMQKDSIYKKYHHNDLTFSMIYNYTENFVLVFSHDEVVHGKKSLINKMPGDLWQKFANLRIAFAFMIGHPGKKLSFMGNEFGQFDEWCESKSLDWHLLNFDHHKKFKKYIKDLNYFYLSNSVLHDDFNKNNFKWIDCDNSQQSLISFIRKSKDQTLIFIINFTPVPLLNHRIGIFKDGFYKEILNSDDLKYGGSGIVNNNLIKSEKVSYNWQEGSVLIKVPPLGCVVLKFIEKIT